MLLQFFSSASQVQHKFTSCVTALSYGRSSLLQALELPNPFNRLFFMTIWVSCDIKYQSINQAGTRKVKTVWILIGQRMIAFWDAVTSAGPSANNLHLAPDR